MRNYKKEYENYHSRPEQKIRRAARNAARRRFKDADPNLDVHHKDNDPLNNDLNNLSLVTQHYNRKEPRLREKKLKVLQAKLTKALQQTEGIDSDAMIDLMQKYLQSKNKGEKKNLLKQINRYQKKLGLKVTEDMGSITGPHIAGTGDDNTVHTKPKKKKVKKRLSLIKGMAKKRLESAPGGKYSKKTQGKINKSIKKRMKKKGIKTNW